MKYYVKINETEIEEVEAENAVEACEAVADRHDFNYHESVKLVDAETRGEQFSQVHFYDGEDDYDCIAATTPDGCALG